MTIKSRRIVKVMLIISLIIIIFYIIRVKRNLIDYNNLDDDIEIYKLPVEDVEDIEKKVIIDIKGEVLYPGVYEIPEDSRVIDVINLAGGLLENANTSNINLASKVTDEEIIIIYSNDVTSNFYATNDEVNIINTTDDLIDINKASLEQLCTIPGIGEAKAKKIIEYREKTKFNTIEDIKNVNSIGDKLFESIKAYIKV